MVAAVSHEDDRAQPVVAKALKHLTDLKISTFFASKS